MDVKVAHDVADRYERWWASGDQSISTMCAPDFVDHVSGSRGLAIFERVGAWLDESFADRWVDHHAAAVDGDQVLVWFTGHGKHVGNGLPRLRDCPVAGVDFSWPQVHAFRVDAGLVVEHWAVRDDYGLVEQLNHRRS